MQATAAPRRQHGQSPLPSLGPTSPKKNVFVLQRAGVEPGEKEKKKGIRIVSVNDKDNSGCK